MAYLGYKRKGFVKWHEENRRQREKQEAARKKAEIGIVLLLIALGFLVI